MLSSRSGNILVTGATGFLGSHFVHEWLQTESAQVFALVRGKGTLTGAGRLAAALEVAKFSSAAPHCSLAESPTPINGDVTLPLAGVAPEDVAQVRKAGVETFWHFASDLRYEDHNREAMWRTNVHGARHALDLAIAVGVKRFVYVSTAYVCGRQGGPIEETLVPPHQEFSNAYEASKAEAERLLVTECEQRGLPLTILRPSIIIGPSTTRCAYGSETGLFALIHALMWIRSSQSGQTANLRIPACADAEINFIPVDCVVSDMLTLAKSGFGTRCIYHLTSSSWVSVAECWQALSEATGMHNVVLVSHGPFEPSPAERRVARRVGFFLSYIGIDRRFIRSMSSTMAPEVADFADYVWKERDRVESYAHGNRVAG
jgi:nucleoside-diphosphate-sugar epimerase